MDIDHNFDFHILCIFRFHLNFPLINIHNLIMIMQNNTNSISEKNFSLICIYDWY